MVRFPSHSCPFLEDKTFKIWHDVPLMRWKWLILFLLLGQSGCHTTPVAPSEAIPVSEDRLYAFQTPSSERNAMITVIRDEGFVGGGCYLAVHINSTKAARLDTGELARFYVEPGTVLVRAGGDPEGKFLCGMDTGNWMQVETTVGAGEEKRFRISIGPDVQVSVLGGG